MPLKLGVGTLNLRVGCMLVRFGLKGALKLRVGALKKRAGCLYMCSMKRI